MNTFGKRFKQLRLDLQLTQDVLVDHFNRKYHYNFGKSAISQYENDKRIPEIDVLKNWADFFKVSVDYLLGYTDLIRGDRIPDILRELGVSYIEVLKKAKKYDISPEELDHLVETIMRMKK